LALSIVSIFLKKVALLQNKDLIVHPTQKLVCIFFLYDMYRNDHIASNPFASVFTYLVVSLKLFKKSIEICVMNFMQKNPPNSGQNGVTKEYHWSLPRLTPQEKFFVSQIITSPSKDVNYFLIECQFQILVSFIVNFLLKLFKKTATQILQMDPSNLHVNLTKKTFSN
jgi:hypothetical protein